MEANYRKIHDDSTAFQGKGKLRLEPGQEMTLSIAGRAETLLTETDPRTAFSRFMNRIVRHEGIQEATNTKPCEERANSRSGCAFSEVSKFNIGIDVVYFDDGTIWGNYGFGYATPNPSGAITRVKELFILGSPKRRLRGN